MADVSTDESTGQGGSLTDRLGRFVGSSEKRDERESRAENLGVSGGGGGAGRKYLKKMATQRLRESKAPVEEVKPLRERLVIHPHSRPKLAFDIVVMVAVLYTATILPVKIAFNLDFAVWLDVLIDLLFILDVFLQFFHGYMDMGYPVLDPRRITRRYVRGWFAVDVVTAIPLDALFHKQLRSFALVKTLRLVRARKLLQSSARARSSALLRVCLTLASWLLIAHWAACSFYALGYYSVCVLGWYDSSWILHYWSPTGKGAWQGTIEADTFCDVTEDGSTGVRGGGAVLASTRYVCALSTGRSPLIAADRH